jgi:hypothetical protein
MQAGATFPIPPEQAPMLSDRLVKLYRLARIHYGPSFPGRSALDSLNAARVLIRWQAAEQAGYLRLRAEPDFDHNPRDYMDADDIQDSDWDAYGSIAEYRVSLDSESWTVADSVWGHVGYRNVLDWRENPYIIDEMAECLDQFRAARKRTVLAAPVPSF